MARAPLDDNNEKALLAQNDVTGAAEPVEKNNTTGGLYVHQVGADVSDVDVTTHTNYAKKYYTNAGAVTDGIVWSPAAGKRWHIVTLYLQVSADATVTLEDDLAAGDSPVWKGEIAAKSGVVLSFAREYPLASGEDASDLLITTTAGNIYITCVGYEL